MNKKLYKFLKLEDGKIKSYHGNFEWEIGKWYKEDEIELCNKGFHASKKIGQAFSYVQGELLAEVEVRGKSLTEDDKEVWSEMKINKVWKWEKKNSVAISIFSAELCLKNFEKLYPNDKRPREAIEAAKKWLSHSTKKNESAAESAAKSTESAAWSTESAAWSAAWSAESAAWSAAKSTESAAWLAKSAAESAAWSAAWSTWSAAKSTESAAESAKSAALKKIYTQFNKEFKKLKEYNGK